MKNVQDRITQMKQKKTQTDSIGKLRILDHNKLIATPIEGNIDDDILVVENSPTTSKPNVDIDIHASTSVALAYGQGNESIEEQQGEEMVPKESIMLKGAHDVKVEVFEHASDQPSTVLKDLRLGEVEEVKTTVLPMVHKVQEEIILIPHIDFVIPNEFDVIEFNVLLFPVLPKMISNLKQVFFVSILILQCFKTRGRISSNQRRMMREMQEDYYLRLLFKIIYICKLIVFLCFTSY